MNLVRLFSYIGFFGMAASAMGVEPWQAELAKMPLGTNQIHFSKSEPARAILRALKPNATVKAIIMMPSSTDELYFNDRGRVVFTNSPTLLDAVTELTNRTSIHATFHPPFILLGETNDYSTPLLTPNNSANFEKLRSIPFTASWVMIDKEWDHLYPTLSRYIGSKITPALGSSDAWHFYRVYFAGYHLNTFEAFELVSFATQTEIHSEKDRWVFSRRPPISITR